MAKCIRCGGSFLTRRKLELADGYICVKCFRELGFDKGYDIISHIYAYDDIKDGIDAYYEKVNGSPEPDDFPAVTISMGNYGQERDLDETDGEIEIFEIIKEMAGEPGIELVRRSDNYVTAVYNEWDLARIKYSERAKWVIFPTVEAGSKKHYIEELEDVRDFADLLEKSMAHIRKYSG